MAWLTGWSYRKPVTLTRASGAVTDYQMKLLLGESSGATGEDVDVGGLCLSSFNDIRFTTSDGETLLDYWIESISGTTPNQLATIWIEFDSVGTSATTFYMYYGNSEASSQYSTPLLAGEATFPFFDNFNDSSLDGEKWTNLEGTGVSEGAGTVTITAASSVEYGIRGKTFFGTAYAMRVRVKPTHYNTTSYLETVRFVNTDGTNQLGSYFCHPGTSWNAKHTNYIGGAYSASSMSGATAATWMVVDIRRNAATNATYLIDNANTVTIINNLTALDLAPDIVAYANGSEIEADWVLVRKYYATEPVWETWGDQEVAAEPIEVVATKPSLTVTANNATVTTPNLFDTYSKRIKLTVDHTKVDSNLSWFPVTVFFTAAQAEEVFAELTSDSDYMKCAFTKEDETTQLFGEMELFDVTGQKAVYHVSKAGWDISSSVDTDFYYYYDTRAADNTTYIGAVNTTPGAAVWDGNFVMVQHMADSTTSTILDSTSNSNDGTKKGVDEPIETVGKVGQGQHFDGTTDWIEVTHSTSLNISSTITVEMLVYPDNAPETGIWERFVRKGTNSWGFDRGSNSYRGFLYDSSSAYIASTNPSPTITNGEWQYISFTYDGANLKLNRNTTEVATEAHTGDIDTNSDNLMMGSQPTKVEDFYDGIMDEVRISSSVRSASWRKATYNSLWDTLLTYGDEEAGTAPESIEVTATKPSLTITAKNAVVKVDINLTAALTELTLTTFNTTVTLDIGPTAPDSSSDQWCDIDTWQWVDNDEAQWGFSVYAYEGLYQIWTDNLYVYAATSSGLDVISVETEQRVSFATNPYGYTTVWSDNDYVFVGTNDSGIKVFRQNDVGPAEIAPSLLDYTSVPDLTSNEIKYIHGNTDKLVCCTAEGVDTIHRGSSYRTHTTISGAKKCFITPNYNYVYYTVSGTDNTWSINRLNDTSSNWQVPDIVYTTGSGFLTEATCLNDFFVTEHTSISGTNNTLFIATDVGVYVYDEGSMDCVVFTTVS